jgi:hypothetical protein
VQRSVINSIIVGLIVFPRLQVASAKDSAAVSGLEEVVVFGVQQEAKASDVKSRRDVCIGFGHGLAVDERAVISEVKRGGLKVHSSEWCVARARGLNIDVVAPINEVSAGTFELTIQVRDPSIKPGEHFATLLKRGTYIIRWKKGTDPQLVSYRQTCCATSS